MKRIRFIALLLGFVLVPGVAGAENRIITYAGNGVATTTGDSGPAVSATLNQPAGLVIAPDGALMIAEFGGNVIRRISVGGAISTFAGTGSGSHTGDGGLATAAGIYGPRDLAYSPNGQVLYVAETMGNTVRSINSGGQIATVAGSGTAGSAGDFGPAGSAQLNGPLGIGVATNGDLYIADTQNNKIRVVTAGSDHIASSTDTITTFAGTGVANTTGDNSGAILAALTAPASVLPMPDGTVLIGDSTSARIRSVDSSGVIRAYSLISSYTAANMAGDGGPVANAVIYPTAAMVSDGSGGILVAESVRHRVRRVTAGGLVSTIAGSNVSCVLTDLCGDYGPAEMAFITTPLGVAGSPTGTLFVSEGNKIRARIYAAGAGGPQGPGGPAGLTGSQGSAGPDGAAGLAGSSGATGSAGTAGAAGSGGPDGPNGSAGRPGRAGSNGPSGRNGLSGVDGSSGGPGPEGQAGDVGTKGESGDPLAFIGGAPLVVALPASRIVVRHGRVILRIYVSTGTSIAARLVKDDYVVPRQRTFLRAGLKQLDLGRLGKGRYRVSVKASDGARRSSTDRATLVVR